MKASSYIKKLQDLVVEVGDLDLVYASDEEGNNFHTVISDPSVMHALDIYEYDVECITEEDVKQYPEDYEKTTKVIVIN